MLALHDAHQALKAHAGVNNMHWQWFEAAVGLAVKLHEHDVPYLYHLRVVFVDEQSSRHFCLFLVGTQVDVYLTAWAAWTCVAHFPEVVVLIAVDDVVFRHVSLPVAGGFVVATKTLALCALKHCGIQVLGVYLHYINKKFPGIIYCALLKIVAKRPVAEHLKHCVVVGVVSHLLKVVVLAAHTQTFLRVGATAPFGLLVAQDYVFELVHARIGEHECGVVLNHHGSRRHYVVAFALIEFLERFADFFCCKHILN